MFCLLVLVLCIVRPNAGRIFLGISFLIMAIAVNVVLVIVAPEQFAALGTEGAIAPLYAWSFEHIVAVAPPVFGSLTAAYAGAVGLLLLSNGRYVAWGLIGGIVFPIFLARRQFLGGRRGLPGSCRVMNAHGMAPDRRWCVGGGERRTRG